MKHAPVFTQKLLLFLIFIALSLTETASALPVGQNFPTIKLNNLQKKSVQVPHPEKRWTVIIMADSHTLQPEINPWLNWLRRIQQNMPSLTFYEIPVIDQKYKAYGSAINVFMKRQLPDSSFYPVTLPLFTSPSQTLKRYQASARQINLWLTDASGNVLFKTTGAMTADKQNAILKQVQTN